MQAKKEKNEVKMQVRGICSTYDRQLQEYVAYCTLFQNEIISFKFRHVTCLSSFSCNIAFDIQASSHK